MTMSHVENTPGEERQQGNSARESLDMSTSAGLRELAKVEAATAETGYTAFNATRPQDEPPFSPTDVPDLKNLTIPTVRERERFGDIQYDIFSRIFKDGTIFLVGPIETGIATLVTSQLMYWNAEDPSKEITIHLNSPGGAVTDGLSIYDTMQQIQNPVSVIISGQACSMGAVIASGGEKGKRFAQPNARIMIHSIRGGTGGIAADLEAQSKEMTRLNDRLTKIIADNCDQPFDKVKEDMRQDYFMGAEEALQYGLIDGIVHPDGSVTRKDDLDKEAK